MKRVLLLTTILCLLLCSCNSPVGDGGEPIAPPDDTTPAVTTPTPGETTPVSVETDPVEPSVYDVLNDFFGTDWSTVRYGAIAVTNAHDLLDVYRYIMSEDAKNWICLRYKFVEGSAYNDYLNNTYTPDYFGFPITGGDNYLIAVMIQTPSSGARFSITAEAGDVTIYVNVEDAPNNGIPPTDDGGYFIYLVPIEGKYEGQSLTIVTDDIHVEQ